MSDHDIADCPHCGKRDYVLKEDGIWICLNCRHTEKMPRSRFDSRSELEANPDMSIGVIVALALIVVMFMMIALAEQSPSVPNQNDNQELRS